MNISCSKFWQDCLDIYQKNLREVFDYVSDVNHWRKHQKTTYSQEQFAGIKENDNVESNDRLHSEEKCHLI